jgi:2-hydroxycyclohexanecarboxyl-CoA dehydrogenase
VTVDHSYRVAIVTGAGGGIGMAIVARLAEHGMAVAAVDINPDTATAAAQHAAEHRAPASCSFALDVADGDAVQNMVQSVVSQWGRVDVLVNNAAVDVPSLFLDSDPASWNTMMRVNVIGAMHCTQHVGRAMVAQSSGSIVQIASEAGRVGGPSEAVYSATKGGLIAFSKAVAKELGSSGVRVNCICPGPVETPILDRLQAVSPRVVSGMLRAIPLGRFGQPEDVANTVAFFASDESAYITGQTIGVSGGITTL